MSTFKRIMSFVLAMVMIMGMLPARAVATETEPAAAEESIPESESVETTVPDEITVEPVPTEPVEEEVAETAAAEDTGDISQEAFEEFLATCDGSYELTQKLTLVKDLEISGVALTLNGGGQVVVSSGTKLILAEDASLTLNEGQVTVEAGGKLIAFGSVKGSITGEGDFLLTQRNRGALTVSGQGMISDGDLDYPGTTSSLFIQEGITGIGARAFDGWKLCEVFLPKSLAFIGAQAFAARFLEGVEFKGDVPALEDPASIFEGTSLLTVSYPSENATWTAEVRESFGPHVSWREYDLGLVASGKCGDNLTWKLLDTGRLTISGTGAMKNFNFKKLETEIPWYSRRKKITAVVVKDGVTGIGDYAFDRCINLADVTLPEGLTYIGESAFSGCSALKAITIPSGVARIGRFAFASCSELETVILSPGVKEISEYAFDCCGKIKHLVIPETVTRIGPMAFYFAEALETLEIQGGDTVLERDAFRRCPALETLVLGDGVKEIGPGVFSECTSLKSVEIPGTVELVGRGAFNPCENLETVVFRDGARAIGAIEQSVFGNCKNLRSVIIGEGIREIGEQAFVQARNLKEVVLPKTLKRIDSQAFDVCTSLTEIVIPGGVEYIGEMAFTFCENLKKITFTGGPPTIHEEAFGYDNSKETMVVATAYYPSDAGWTKDNLKNYGGRLTWVADKTQHEHIPVVDPAVAADCITTGRTEGSYCSVCGRVLVAQQIIPAAGHHFANGACTNCGKTDNGTCGSNVRWALDNGILIIYGKGAMYNFVNDTVPWKNYRDNITGVVIQDGITRIGDYAFWNLRSLTKVQIPESVTYIGESAFSFAAFKEVKLPAKLTVIGNCAFHSCKALESIDIPDSVTEIDICAFEYCEALKSVVLSSNLQIIGAQAFSATALESINFPTGLKEIGRSAFAGCPKLKYVVIPETVSSIGASAFHNCPVLEYAEIQGGNTILGRSAFSYCPVLASLVLGEGILEIGEQAFALCHALQSVEVPGTVKRIEKGAFEECQNLKTVVLHAGTQYIGESAFESCLNMSSVTLPEDLVEIGNNAFYQARKLKEIVLPDSLECIGAQAFYECFALKEIMIPGKVESIGSGAFGACTDLKKVFFKGTAPTIADNAFCDPETNGRQVSATVYYSGDPSWTKDKLQNYGGKLKWVVDKTLHTHDPVIDPAVEPDCVNTGLTEGSRCSICDEVLVAQQVIPALGHTEVIDEAVAPDCVNTGLTEGSHCGVCGEILVEQQILPPGDHTYRDGFCTGCGEADGGACGDNTRWVFDNGTLTIYGTGAIGDGIGPWGDFCDDITAVVVQEGVTAIGTDAFYGCNWLKNVTLPDSLTQIGDDAFRGCTQLETVSLPESLKTIGYGAFRESTKLKEITIPKNVVSLGEAAFAECTGLELIHIPNGVTEIKDATFSFCTSLKSIHLPGSVTRIGVLAFDNCTALETVVAETGLTVIDAHAFELCGNLVSVTIPDTVVSIGEQAFSDCVSLKTIAVFEDSSVADVAVPEGVTSLGKNCFRECTNLESVTLPRGIIHIPDIAFRNCEKLHTFIMRGDIRSIGEAAFENCQELKTLQVGINTEPQVMPGTLETIGARAFNDCKLLRLRVQIPEGMTEIGESTFRNTKLQTVTIPTSVKTIGKSAFSGCTKLEGVVIPGTVEVIGEEAFYDCLEMKTLLLEEGIREIKRNAFGCCESLRTLEIPGTVEHLDKDAFQGCAYVRTLVVHEGVRSIGEWTFAHFYYVSSVTLPDSLERIGARAFYNALHLKEIVIPENVEYIGEAAFWGCGTLKKVYFCGKAPVIDEMFGDPYANPNDPVRVVTATIYYPGDESWTEDKLQDYGGKLTWVVDRCLDGHDAVTDPVVEPGCVLSGLTEGSHCTDCGEILVAQEMIPATRHDFVNGVCLNCGGEDKSDYVLFSAKSLTLQEINPATGKAYTAKEITWALAQGGEAYATLAANGKLTASAIYEQVRIEAVATIAQEKKQIIRLIDLSPAISGLDVLREEEIVTGKTVNMGFTDDALVLTARTQPYDISGVTWTVSDTKGQYAEYTIDGSSLTIENPTGKAGTVTVKAAIDAGAKKNVTVKVAFGGFAKTVEITAPEDTDLKGGESLTLTAAITEPDVISKPGIVWSVSDKTAATVSGGKVKAKNVANPTWVTVTATSKDGLASDSLELKILPKNEGQLVLMDGDTFVTNANKVLDKGEELWLSAAVITEGLPVPVEAEWTSSKATVASVDETGMVMANANGTAKITAQVGTMKAVVNVKVTTLAKTVEITTKDGKNLDADGNVIVASGKNVVLAANIQPKDAARAVNWEIVEGGQYAKVSNGKVTANKNLTEIRYAAVKATAKDCSDVSGTIWVKILPLATGIQLYREGMAVRTGSTYIHDMMESTVLDLSAKVYPAQAGQSVELTSSSKKIADFVDGQLVCFVPGTVTITAKALDGSNKKVSFKLNIVKRITDLSVKEGSNLTVVGGKSLKLAPMVEINPSDATNKKLTWSVAPNAYGIKINASGVLSTKKVTAPVTINVMVTTQDGSGQMLSFDVTVKPS